MGTWLIYGRPECEEKEIEVPPAYWLSLLLTRRELPIGKRKEITTLNKLTDSPVHFYPS